MPNTNTNIQYRDLADLTVHPALKNQPRLANDHPTMLSMRKEMKRRGEDNQSRSVLVTNDGQIVDGRHWYWNAKALQWKQLRCEIVEDSEVHSLIMSTLMNRRHFTKAQLAFIVTPMIQDVWAEAKKRALATQNNDAAKAALHSVQSGGEKPEDVAARLGISYRVLAQAQEIHEYFKADGKKRTMTDREGVTEKSVTFKEFFEPRILLEEDPEAPRTRAYGLGAVLAGIKASLAMETKEAPHGGGRPKNIQKQLNLFEDAWGDVKSKFTYWQQWEPETRQAALGAIPPVVEKMPDELLAEFEKAIRQEKKRRGAEKQ